MTGAETIRTRATESPSFRTVRFGVGSSRANEPSRSGWSAPSTTRVGAPSEHEEELLVIAVDLVVLGDRVARWQLDRVDPERAHAERAPHQHPLAVVPLELLVVPDGERVHRCLPGSPARSCHTYPDRASRPLVRIGCGVTSYAEARRLPRGWAHLALQFAVWFGFYAAYQVVRGAADREVAEAFWNGTLVIEAENRFHALIEPTVQGFVQSSGILIFATSYTYWLSQFAVVGLTLLFVYFRHYDRFTDFRNWLIGANLIGLIGYVLMPTAPPRMFPEWGFTDTLADYASVNHDSGLIAFAANPYAAMPSLHAMDALIVGVVMASVCRSWPARALWFAWPAWVCFSVMGTGNHYWLDCVAGFAVALLTALLLFRKRLPRVLAGPRERPRTEGQPTRSRQAGVHGGRAGDPARGRCRASRARS